MEPSKTNLSPLHENTPLPDARYCVVDVETTGLEPYDRIVEVAAVRFEFGKPTAAFQTLVNPRMPINPVASAAHFLTNRDLYDAPFMEEVNAPLDEFVGTDLVVAHNAKFDRRHLPVLQDRTWLCTYRFARHLWVDAPSYKNQVLRYWLGLDAEFLQGVTAHRALGDCLVTGLLFRRELRAYDARFCLGALQDVVKYVESPVRVECFHYGRKHRNDRIAEIPTHYLQWVLTDSMESEEVRRLHLDEDTMAAVKFELLSRAATAAA